MYHGLGVMYIDKLMQGSQLMQAIARVNRPYQKKEAGLIVDYIGLQEQLLKAIDMYTVKNEVKIIETKQIKNELLKRMKTLKDLLSKFYGINDKEEIEAKNYELIKEIVEFILQNEMQKEIVMQKTEEIKNKYPLCVTLLKENEVNEILLWMTIRNFILKISEEDTDLGQIDRKQEKMLEEKMKENLKIKTDKIRNMPQINIAMILFVGRVKKWIDKIGEDNVLLKEKFTVKLNEVNENYKQRTSSKDTKEAIIKLENLTCDIQNEIVKASKYKLSGQEKSILDRKSVV